MAVNQSTPVGILIFCLCIQNCFISTILEMTYTYAQKTAERDLLLAERQFKSTKITKLLLAAIFFAI